MNQCVAASARSGSMFRGLRPLALLGMAALVASCAETPQAPSAASAQVELVYPLPPDEPRFYFERTIQTNLDVMPATESAKLRAALTGQVGTEVEGLGKPYGVAVHQGRIFVSDSADRFVKVFDVPGGFYFRIGEDDPGVLAKPLGLDTDRNGTLYVADATAKGVMVYDRDGKFLRKIGKSGDFDRLSSVTADPDGKRIFVTDIGGVSSENHRIRVYDAVSGSHLFDIGKRGRGEGEFNLPRDVAIGKDGRIYVVDGGNFRVQVFDRNGQFLKSFGKVGKQYGDFARPKEIAADNNGNVYVIDTAFGNFQIFSPEGELLLFIGERSEAPGPARYMLPSGIFVDEDGRVYVVDQWFRKIDIFRPATVKTDQGFLVYREKGAGKR